jgi:hypothetical protein
LKDITDRGTTTNTDPRIDIGYSGKEWYGEISEFYVYPALNDLQRLRIYQDVQRHYKGTGIVNRSKHHATGSELLPQWHQWHRTLYQWLKDRTESDFDLTPANLSWDSTYADTEELSMMWHYQFGPRVRRSAEVNNQVIRMDKKWFVLDDGAGSGIEGSGVVRRARWPTAGVYWYDYDLPLAAGQGNPYHQNQAVAYRSLAMAIAELLMTDAGMDESPSYLGFPFTSGGQLLGIIDVFIRFWYQLDDDVRDAICQGLMKSIRRWRHKGAMETQDYSGNNNANMDARAVPVCTAAYTLMTRAIDKQHCIEAVRRMAFGRIDRGPDDPDKLFGYSQYGWWVNEGRSPDGYNGISIFHFQEAWSHVKDDPDWDFLHTCVDRMTEYRSYHIMPDPDGTWHGSSSICGRTGDGNWWEQRDRSWRDGPYGHWNYPDKQYVHFRHKEASYPDEATEAEMVTDINGTVSYHNSTSLIGTVDTDTPGSRGDARSPIGSDWWPMDVYWAPPTDWWQTHQDLIAGNSVLLKQPYEKPEPHNRNFGNYVWAYKDTDLGGQQFAWLVENAEQPRHHDKTGGSYDDTGAEANARDFTQMELWAAHHFWGYDDDDNEMGGEHGRRRFSTLLTEPSDITGLMPDHINYWGIDDPVPHVRHITRFGDAVRQEYGLSEENKASLNRALPGEMRYQTEYTALDDGLRIDHTIDYIPGDVPAEFKYLWLTFPINLRDVSVTGGYSQTGIPDSVIEYWTGAAWTVLGTSIVSTDKIRITRDFGDGPKYAYMVFSEMLDVRLNGTPITGNPNPNLNQHDPVYQQIYQDEKRSRMLWIDLHGNPGVLETIWTHKEVRIDLRTSDEDESSVSTSSISTSSSSLSETSTSSSRSSSSSVSTSSTSLGSTSQSTTSSSSSISTSSSSRSESSSSSSSTSSLSTSSISTSSSSSSQSYSSSSVSSISTSSSTSSSKSTSSSRSSSVSSSSVSTSSVSSSLSTSSVSSQSSSSVSTSSSSVSTSSSSPSSISTSSISSISTSSSSISTSSSSISTSSVSTSSSSSS